MSALRIPSRGQVFDLDPGRFPGMPLWEGHPPFQVVTYRTPMGIRNQGDQEWLMLDRNKVGLGLISELLIATCHSGAHIDALAHFTTGDDDHWHGGIRAAEGLGDFGPLTDDAASIPPLITRGILVDVAGLLGVDRLPRGYAIGREEFERTLERQRSEIHRGDVVLVRTGQMSVWPDKEAMAQTKGAGVTREVAEAALQAGVIALGADTESCEVMPSVMADNPHPVHELMLVEQGAHILENLYLEDLARAREWEFLFIALPLKIRGATASMVRPLAII